jgi:hypothetical protein
LNYVVIFLGPLAAPETEALAKSRSGAKDAAEMNKYAHKKRQPTREPAG